ncbi:GntR family transcriptional regulator [Sinomonas mesophila]|uniref:GntR family transcriptional regulator n=1 Tax=Sinomonas mesophila TaxID=1531955 RepID=UPI0009876D92|nr:GntR family transcriptional regulator [Sinomonas mesophila]
MTSETGAPPPLHRQLEAEIRARIASGRWRPGTSLPSEASLSTEFGVSRGTVRQALTGLRDEGLLFGGRGRRPIVRSGAKSQPFSTFLSFTEWARSQGLNPGQRTLEVARREAGAEACCALGLSDGTQVVDILRLRLLDGEPAMLERSSFVLDVGRLIFDFDAESGSIFEFLGRRGVALDRAHHTIDAVAASTADAQLLGIQGGSPLLRERRTTYDTSGRPVEYSDDRYLPTLTNFSIENRVGRAAPLVRHRPS